MNRDSIYRFNESIDRKKKIKTFYNKGNYQNYAKKYNPQNRQNHLTFKPRTPLPYNNRQQQTQTQHNRNLCDRNGTQLQCSICQSIYDMAQQCSEKRDTYYKQEMVLYQSNFDYPEKLKILVSETWSAAVVDSAATNTVVDKI